MSKLWVNVVVWDMFTIVPLAVPETAAKGLCFSCQLKEFQAPVQPVQAKL
jgi:hypothetical protein